MVLSDRQRREIQKKLGHLLLSYRQSHGLTQAEMAERLDYRPLVYSRIERGEEQRISNTIEYLNELGNIVGKSASELVQHLEGTPIHQRANLSENEAHLLTAYSNIPLDMRREFVHEYCSADYDKLKIIMELSLLAKRLSKEQLYTFVLIAESVLKRDEVEFPMEERITLASKVIESIPKALGIKEEH